MNGQTFEWDVDKAAANKRKHGVTFEEAMSVFDDPHRLQEYDRGHSSSEDRWLMIGVSNRFRVLSVFYVNRNENVRIISARRADKAETRRYTGEA